MKPLTKVYAVKEPKSGEEKLRITNIVPVCEICEVEMRFVGNSSCVIDDHYSYTYQCPKCKTIEMTEQPYGNYTYKIDSPESKWKLIKTI